MRDTMRKGEKERKGWRKKNREGTKKKKRRERKGGR